MRRHLASALLAAALSCVGAAATVGQEVRPSLFFTPDEVQRARAFVESGTIPGTGGGGEAPPQISRPPTSSFDPPAVRPREPTPDIRLGALMYWSDTNWVLWINGQAYRPGTAPPPFRVLAVTETFADIEWRSRDGSGIVRARLAPNQVRRGSTGEIVGGPSGVR